MTIDEQEVWNAAFGAAYAYAHSSDSEGFNTLTGCMLYARIVADDAVKAYREVMREKPWR